MARTAILSPKVYSERLDATGVAPFSFILIPMKRIPSLVLVLVAGLCPAGEWAQSMAQTSSVKPLSPAEFQALEKKGKIYFLDVREAQVLQEFGTMKGYVNIPLSQLEKRLAEVPKNGVIVTA